MAHHPYAPPSNTAFHHQHRVSSTPSSSMSQLSIDSHLSQPPPVPSFDHSLTATAGSSSSNIPIGPPPPPDMSASGDTPPSIGPQRRRRRSLRGVPKPASRKKSEGSNTPASSVASIPEDPSIKDVDDAHVPTRSYQFKAFSSFDSSVARAGTVPRGSEYTFGPPQTTEPPPPDVLGSYGATHQPNGQPKKGKALFTVGKRVVKEVLGGGGNYAPQPEAKAVYYGRGGAGGAAQRSNKLPNNSTASPHPASDGTQSLQPGPKPSIESHRSSSYYTGSSAYTPSVVSSPYAESIASSPYATSVDDGSMYGGSSYSGPHTMASLQPSSRPSPSHRSLSPAAYSDSRRDSIASSYPGTLSTSDGDEVYDGSAMAGDAHWSSPLGAGSQRQLTPLLGEDLGPTGNAMDYLRRGSRDNTAYGSAEPLREELGAGPNPLRHRPSKPSLLSYSSGMTVQRAAATAAYPTPPSIPSLFASPYLAAATTATDPIGSVMSSPHGHAHLTPPTPRYPATPSPSSTSSLMGAVTDPRGPEFRPLPEIGVPPPPPQFQLAQTPQVAWTQTNPSGASRPLPDPLAQAVGQLSLVQNPLNLGWPVPQNPAQYYGSSVSQPSNTNSRNPQQYRDASLADAFQLNPGTCTPNYFTQPAHHAPSAAYPGDASTGDDEYEAALAEQQALARRLAELEQLQQQNTRMAYQSSYSNGGRMM